MLIDLKDLKVLVADDHFLARQTIFATLRGAGIRVVHMASNGNETISIIQKAQKDHRPYDFVFLDWNMPDISGLDVLNYFRSKSEHTSTAFVMLTAESEQKNLVKAIHAGAVAYLIKPLSREELQKKFLEIYEKLKSIKSRQQTSALF